MKIVACSTLVICWLQLPVLLHPFPVHLTRRANHPPKTSSTPRRQNIPIYRSHFLCYSSPIPVRCKRGGRPVVTNVDRVAVDAGSVGRARRSQSGLLSVSDDAARGRTTQDAYGQIAWSWLSWLQPRLAETFIGSTGSMASVNSQDDGDKGNSSPGRARIRRQTTRAGKAGRFRLHLCFRCAFCVRI